ncbi:site-specific integrase [Microbacterium sp. Y-01]|uniref:tyrosine-type recombinase/integrase n=1 Tax=Microbacterium sp. Y-01 TaxID=2048898 RepID=UPI0013DE4293|nr:site-specific integrase [Microbacterium sp. Y-01]
MPYTRTNTAASQREVPTMSTSTPRIRQLKSGRWQVRVWDGTAYASLGTYPTEDEAKIVVLKFRAGVFSEPKQTPAPIPRGREKFGKFALEVIQSRKHTLSPSTYHFHLWNLDAHLKPFENVALADVTYSAIVKWWHSMDDKPNSRKSAYGTLSTVMKRAVKLGKIPSSPCMIEGASKDFSKPRPLVPTDDIKMMMLVCTDQQMLASLWVLLGTGCRIGELLALTWADVDLNEGTIRIDKHLTIHGIQRGTKAHADGKRTLIMPEEATDALRTLSRSRVPMPDVPVFLNARGGRLTYHKYRQRFTALRDSVGLTNVNIHDLRHIHLTEYARHATLREVMDRAGHTDVASAMRYQHASPERERAIVEKLKL